MENLMQKNENLNPMPIAIERAGENLQLSGLKFIAQKTLGSELSGCVQV
jgi:hypothetical protein